MRCLSRFGIALMVLCLSSGLAGMSRAEERRAGLPKASVHFDGQTLRLAYATADDVLALMEFIPDGQTLDRWTNLAAVHVYKNVAIGPRKRAAALAAQIRKSNPKSPIAFHDSPDGRQRVVAFATWSADAPFVEFNVFAFATDASGHDVGLQYAVREKADPETFVQRDFGPLRDRLVRMILRHGLHATEDSDLTLVRLALSPPEQAICDTILKDGPAGLEAVLQQPEERSSLVLFVAAAIAFNDARLEDSAFLFYAGQLRLRFDERCFPPKVVDGKNPIHSIRSYSMQLGEKINPAVMDEPRMFSQVLDRVARWKPRVPDAYQPGYEHDTPLTEEAARAAAEPYRADCLRRLGDCATLLNDADYFAATQVVNNLRVPGEDRLPTKEEYEAAIRTRERIELEKGIDLFGKN